MFGWSSPRATSDRSTRLEIIKRRLPTNDEENEHFGIRPIKLGVMEASTLRPFPLTNHTLFPETSTLIMSNISKSNASSSICSSYEIMDPPSTSSPPIDIITTLQEVDIEEQRTNPYESATSLAEYREEKTLSPPTLLTAPESPPHSPASPSTPPTVGSKDNNMIMSYPLSQDREYYPSSTTLYEQQTTTTEAAGVSNKEASKESPVGPSAWGGCPFHDTNKLTSATKKDDTSARGCPWKKLCSWKEMMGPFRALKLLQVLLALYCAIATILDPLASNGTFHDPSDPLGAEQGLIHLADSVESHPRPIAATTTRQFVELLIARISAWFMYPCLVLVFLSKYRATAAWLSQTPLTLYMKSDTHDLHVYCGWNICWCAILHTSTHVARWAEQGNLRLLVSHASGLTGLIVMLSTLVIVLPMGTAGLRNRIHYELRKRVHYLFVLFLVAMMFHVHPSALPKAGYTMYVFGILLVWYLVDVTYCYCFMTEKVATTRFSVMPSGVRLTMTVSERFQKSGGGRTGGQQQGGICYICLPWVSRDQWHPFSLFENPQGSRGERQIFIQKNGDWTTEVHRLLQRDTVRPAWIQGPFPSPYDNAVCYDNQILVASGIGITPALSVIQTHRESRRINLFWMVRDRHLLQFFLRHMYLDHQGWNLIFYTGKEPIEEGFLPESLGNTNICIIQGRPKLQEVIPNIIYGIESGLGLPERYVPEKRLVASKMIADRWLETANCRHEKALDVACYASNLGFTLPVEKMTSVEDGLLQTNDNHPPCPIVAKRRLSMELASKLGVAFKPWHHHADAFDYVKQLEEKTVLRTWGMMYCGGAKPVLSALEDISEDYRISLHVESFSW